MTKLQAPFQHHATSVFVEYCGDRPSRRGALSIHQSVTADGITSDNVWQGKRRPRLGFGQRKQPICDHIDAMRRRLTPQLGSSNAVFQHPSIEFEALAGFIRGAVRPAANSSDSQRRVRGAHRLLPQQTGSVRTSAGSLVKR